MTEEFLSRVYSLQEYATGDIYKELDLIEAALQAVNEGITDNRVITRATSYTNSVYIELLERVKSTLLKICQQLLTALNSYYMNNAKLCQKYRNVLAKGLEKVPNPILHDTYTYPDTKGYPRSIRSAAIENEVVRLQRDIGTQRYTGQEIGYRVDDMIEVFGKKVLDITPDPWNLSESVKDIVTKKIRGPKMTVRIDVTTLDEWIKSITEYRKDRDDLMNLKKDIVDDYETLKRTLGSATKPEKMVPGRTNLQRVYDPEMESFHDKEYARFSDIHTEMMRLFNGYITIYKEAFATKLTLLDEKINDQRNTLIEVMTRTGTFAAINNKTPSTDNNIIPYNPQPVS